MCFCLAHKDIVLERRSRPRAWLQRKQHIKAEILLTNQIWMISQSHLILQQTNSIFNYHLSNEFRWKSSHGNSSSCTRESGLMIVLLKLTANVWGFRCCNNTKTSEGSLRKKKKKTLLGLESVCLLIFIFSPLLTFVLPDIKNDSNIIIPTVQLKLQMNILTWR